MHPPEFNRPVRLRFVFAALAMGMLARADLFADAPKTDPGLKITFITAEGGQTDTATIPNVRLLVPTGKPPTPFLPAGRFTAIWEGFASIDLRDSYTFQAELNGRLLLELNGELVLDATSDGKTSDRSKRVRLNKGPNALKATFTSPDQGDAFLRLAWSSPDFLPEPIASPALTHDAGSPELAKGLQLRLGRELFLENRCNRCHLDAGLSPQNLPDLGLDAPNFTGIGARRNFDWLARWIEHPRSARPLARMPKLLHGPSAKADAEAIAAYLASLKDDAFKPQPEPGAGLAAQGKDLFETLHCVACHISPEDPKPDPKKIALDAVKQKFAAGTLAAFLQNPRKDYAWIRMPDFHLTSEEANQLSAYLLSKAGAANTRPAPGGDIVARGKQLIATAGCLSCHNGPDANQFKARPLATLAPDRWTQGCVADTESANAPFFAFTAEQRAALQAFARTDHQSLQRHVPPEFAERHIRGLNCLACHGQFDGFPQLPILGGKLKPEWMRAFLAGEIKYKPRPWLPARMPSFATYAEGLAQGMAMEHGFPPQTPPEPPVNMELAQKGRAMISTDGGFSCIACHAVREFGAQQVFESAGINLAHPGERLQPAYFRRWLNSPLRIDPQTKMPVYFDQGRSPLPDYFDGDGAKQIDALWQYLRLGPQMPLPKEAQTQ